MYPAIGIGTISAKKPPVATMVVNEKHGSMTNAHVRITAVEHIDRIGKTDPTYSNNLSLVINATNFLKIVDFVLFAFNFKRL